MQVKHSRSVELTDRDTRGNQWSWQVVKLATSLSNVRTWQCPCSRWVSPISNLDLQTLLNLLWAYLIHHACHQLNVRAGGLFSCQAVKIVPTAYVWKRCRSKRRNIVCAGAALSKTCTCWLIADNRSQILLTAASWAGVYQNAQLVELWV